MPQQQEHQTPPIRAPRRQLPGMNCRGASAVLLLVMALRVQPHLGRELSLGPCPRHPVQIDFDVERYSGLWYEYSKLKSMIQVPLKCVSASYTTLTEGAGSPAKIGILNWAINEKNGYQMEAMGEAVLDNPYDPFRSAEMLVTFSDLPHLGRPSTPNYKVILTDYHSFSVVYACQPVLFFKSEHLRILTRRRHPGKELIQHLYSTIDKLGLNSSRLSKTNQKGCRRHPFQTQYLPSLVAE